MRTSPWRIAALALVLLTGALGMWWTVSRSQDQLRADLLQQARLAVRAVDLERIQALTGTKADEGTPGYLRLKGQLAAIRSTDSRCRFVYLIGRKADGVVYFFVDSEHPESGDLSPPGQIYEEVPAEYLQVFDTKTAAVAGPVSDRWGSWVTALVPLTDPSTGELIAVLGMDIDAMTWKWDVATSAALPSGLLLILLIGVISILAAVRHTPAPPQPVSRRLWPPLAVMVAGLILVAAVLPWQQYRKRQAEKTASEHSEISALLRLSLEHQTSELAVAARAISLDPRIPQALRNADTNRLLTDWRPLFEAMCRENKLTHLYFLDSNRMCLLRAHKPEKKGDRIDRFTALEAEHTGKTASGLELGVLGLFTLRVVQPVFMEGVVVGYTELGKEIEDILQTVRAWSESQVAVIIHKTHLKRPEWEDGMRLLGRDADWDRFPHCVIGYASHGYLPDAFIPPLDPDPEGTHGCGEMDREMTTDGRDWRISATPLREASGKAVGCLLIMSDITAEHSAFHRMMTLGGASSGVLLAGLLGLIFVLLHRTDAGIRAQHSALRESVTRYELVQEGAEGGIWDWDVPHRRVHFSSTWKAMRGYDDSELGDSETEWSSGIHPDDAARVMAAVGEHFEGRTDVFREEYRVRRKDGSYMWVLDRGKAVRDETGQIVRMAGSEIDITEHKHAEVERERALALLEASIAQSPLGILIADAPDVIVRRANAAALEILGVTDIPMNGIAMSRRDDHWQTARPNGSAYPVVEQPLARAILTGEITRNEELVVVRASGENRWVSSNAAPIRDHDGSIACGIVIFQDITEHKRAEKEREKLQVQLSQARKMEAVGRLAGGVAHDFNNMLGVILGHTDLAHLRAGPSSPLHLDLERIREAAGRSADLTRQLLAFARKQIIAPKVLDLNKVVEGMLKILRRLIGENIQLIWAPEQELWPVEIDPSQIDQILANLCANARDAIADVGKITIETHNQFLDETYRAEHSGFRPGEYVLLAVSDNGSGMRKETLADIFEPFFTTKEPGKGTGLGLATVYGIVKQNDGFIYAYSELGEGTTFKVYLPRRTGKAEQPPKKGPHTPAARGHEIILLVEDEPAILESSRMMLEGQGYTVLTAGTPGEAIGRAEAHSGEIHLLLTDVIMPEMNGRDLVKALLPLYPDMKHLFMSGYTADVIAHHGVLDEGVHFIQKPFSLRRLAAKVREVLETRERMSEI